MSLVVLTPAYLGFFKELQGYSDRAGEMKRADAVAANALDPKALSSFASPFIGIIGSPKGKSLWPTDIAMSSIYLSPLLLVLAAGGLWLRPRDAFRWWLAAWRRLPGRRAGRPFAGARLALRSARANAIFSPLGHVSLLLCLDDGDPCRALRARVAVAHGSRGSPLLEAAGLVALVAAAAALTTLAVVGKAAHLDAKDLPTFLLAVVHGLLVWLGMAAQFL